MPQPHRVAKAALVAVTAAAVGFALWVTHRSKRAEPEPGTAGSDGPRAAANE